MQFSVTFRHIEATEALKSYAKERLEKIRKYFPDPISVHVVMSTERGYKHQVDVTMQLHNGLTVAGHEATENMYSSIDLVAAKIERQVRRYKDKLRAHKVKTPFEPLPWAHTVIAPAPDTEGEEAATPEPASSITVEAPATERPSAVVKTEQLQANPMSVDEAIMQLNLLHKQFFVFRRSDNGAINVLYRREDDSYGLIETTSAPAMVENSSLSSSVSP